MNLSHLLNTVVGRFISVYNAHIDSHTASFEAVEKLVVLSTVFQATATYRSLKNSS